MSPRCIKIVQTCSVQPKAAQCCTKQHRTAQISSDQPRAHFRGRRHQGLYVKKHYDLICFPGRICRNHEGAMSGHLGSLNAWGDESFRPSSSWLPGGYCCRSRIVVGSHLSASLTASVSKPKTANFRQKQMFNARSQFLFCSLVPCFLLLL